MKLKTTAGVLASVKGVVAVLAFFGIVSTASAAGWTEEVHPRERSGRFAESGVISEFGMVRAAEYAPGPWPGGPPLWGGGPSYGFDAPFSAVDSSRWDVPGHTKGLFTYGHPSDAFKNTVVSAYRSAPAALTNSMGYASLHVFDSVQTFRAVTGKYDTPSNLQGYSVNFLHEQYADLRGHALDNNFTRIALIENTLSKQPFIIQRQAVMHEMLHAVDFEHGASSDKAFIDAFNKDVTAQTVQKLAKDGYTQFSNPKEAFAEAGSRLVQPINAADPDDAAKFEADFPNTLAYMEMVLLRVGVLEGTPSRIYVPSYDTPVPSRNVVPPPTAPGLTTPPPAAPGLPLPPGTTYTTSPASPRSTFNPQTGWWSNAPPPPPPPDHIINELVPNPNDEESK